MKVDEKYVVNGYYPTIGIECHVQLKTASKLFSSESNDARDAEPNTLLSHVTFGLPGALPVLNEHALRLSAYAAFALGTTPQKFSKFDRKHYFYPDLPFGYQITQFDEPIILGGSIDVTLPSGESRTIEITRAHIEADAGKSTHPAGADYSLVDLNRAGTPLLEIVSEPVMHNAQEAKAYAKELWLRMKYAGVSDVDLYHGNMRFDVNVSVSKDPSALGTRTETKNLNSFKSVERAIDYEIRRQIEAIESGKEIIQETRGWVDDKQKTVSQRSKENAHDYRYFPDPDIPPVVLSDEYIAEIKREMPVMPQEWREKLAAQKIDDTTIETLLEFQVESGSDFLALIAGSSEASAKVYANWLINIEVPFMRENPDAELTSSDREQVYSHTHALVSDGKLSSNNAKTLLEKLFVDVDGRNDIEATANTMNLIQVSDAGELQAMVQKVLDANPDAVNDIKNGEMKAIGFLVGQVMKESKGQANPGMVNGLIKKLLEL